MRTIVMTCETKGCENENLPIELETDATQYMCGACMTFITNVTEKTHGSTEAAE